MSSATFRRATLWTGNTYAAREAIKGIGGRWNAEDKCWEVPALNMKTISTAKTILHKNKGITVEAA